MNENGKIREAEYFYCQMLATQGIRDHFKFNLSAFLSAARSVLQYDLKEAETRTGGYAWYELRMRKSPVLAFFKDKRDANIHAEPVDLRTVIDIHAREEHGVRLSDAVSVTVFEEGRVVGRYESALAEPVTASESASAPVTIRTIYRFEDWPGAEDVFQLCTLYLTELRAVVTDGQSKGYLS